MKDDKRRVEARTRAEGYAPKPLSSVFMYGVVAPASPVSHGRPSPIFTIWTHSHIRCGLASRFFWRSADR